MTRWETAFVSFGKSCVFLVLCWALVFFYCFAVASCGETQIWVGDLRVVCRFSPVSCSGDVLICQCIVWKTTAFHAEFSISLTCLYQFQDRALERHEENKMTFTDAVETMITLPPCFILHIQYQDFRQFAEDAPIFLTDGWPPASLAPSWHPLLVRRHQRWPHEERPACILQDHSERIFLVALRHPNAQLQPGAWRFIFPMRGPLGGLLRFSLSLRDYPLHGLHASWRG